jgi:putative Ca2+/H+ antiporter (TMEM165/GDT1 family)
LMGYISVQMGLILPELVPTYWIDIVAVLIFFILGVKMLIEGIKMKSESESEMYNQIQREINKEIIYENEILFDEEKNNLISKEKFSLKECLETFIQTFILIFLSELGDKSQISTIYLSSNSDPMLIFYSVCFAQILLSIIAVIGGTFVSGRISEKNMTLIAGILFLAFGLISMYLTYINDYVIINSAVKNYLKNHNKNLNLTNHIPDRQTIMNSFLQLQAN